jgi:ATP/maltotriose-dependent transcriptional regulator MalT/DNA-binding SARP family transcriptional activator
MPGLALVKKTKILIPRRRPEVLRRQRLIDFLHSHIDRRLLLVSAPAGYGKTTLLVDFATDTDLLACWYSLDSTAQEPRVFLEHIIAAIQQRFPSFGQRTIQTLDSTNDFTEDGLNPVLVSLVNDIVDEVPEYFALILDDFHLIEQSQTVTRFVTRFLQDAPENCCLIVAGRTVPGRLPIVALASKQQVAGLGSNDLRFTPEETVLLVRQMYGLELRPEEAEALAQDSEGWITGILLSTHSLWQGLIKGMILARGTMTVYDYLASEVFAQQDPQVQDFLLGTSILEDMTPELCDAVLETNNSWAMLNLLEERNLFLNRLEGETLWYRYHRLFQGYLVSRLQRENPKRFVTLHQRAAAFWEAKGDLHQAISHLLLAGDYSRAAERMEQVAAKAFVSGQHLLLTQWHEALPPEVTEGHPRLLVQFGKANATQGQHEFALSLLNKAQELFSAAKNAPGMAQAAVQKATVLRITGHYAEAEGICSQAESLMPEIDPATAAEIYRCWGTSLGQSGKFTDAVERLKEALKRYEDDGREFNVAQVRTDLGSFLERMGNMEDALAHFEKAVETFRRFRNPAELANALNSVGVIYYYRGEYDRARETLHEALLAAHEAGSGRWTGYILAGLGDIERDAGRMAEALDHYEKALSLLDEKREGFLSVYIRAAQAEVYAAQGEPLQARDLGRQALDLAASHHSSYEEALANTALGLTWLTTEPDRAVQTLESAAEQFRRSGAARDLARSVFLLASALYGAGARDHAFARLQEALSLAGKLRYENALKALSRWGKPLLAAAAEAGIDTAGLAIEGVPAQAAPPQMQPAPMPVRSIRLQGLGMSRVEVDGEVVFGRWGKVRELLFLFATQNQGRGLQREAACEALWPGVPEAKAFSNFHALTYRVRKAMQGSLHFEDNVYQFAPPHGFTYDVTEFQMHITKAQMAGSEEESIGLYQKAIALYHGEFLRDLLAEWSFPLQQTLRDMFLLAISRVAGHFWQIGKTDMAIAVARRWLDEDPADEAAHRLLLRCFAAQGNLSAVKRQFVQCEETLRRELEVEPDEETRDLYAKLLSDAR